MDTILDKLLTIARNVEGEIAPQVAGIEQIAERNQWKVIEAFRNNRVSDFHFHGSTGYGYNDTGREVLDQVYAQVFGAEAALVRPHFVSGTHTICTALFGLLRPNDELIYITGEPYDTLHKVIGKPGDGTGSLADFGIGYKAIDLTEEGLIDYEAVSKAITPRTRVIGIQRSRGYDWRKSFTVADIAMMVQWVRKHCGENVFIFVDNCYGEFTEELEPCAVGVDLIAGSLIKNPGGGLAPMGGYVAGTAEAVRRTAYRLTAPGIGGDVGATLGAMRSMFQGLFLAPHVVGQAIRGSVFAAAMFAELGFATSPAVGEVRTDLIQAVRFDTAEQLIAFIQGIQRAAAVDSHVVPEPWAMPGYEHPVIMAAGTFIQGGSVELSADAPIREPYTAYVQGGLTYAHVKLGIIEALRLLAERNLIVI